MEKKRVGEQGGKGDQGEKGSTVGGGEQGGKGDQGEKGIEYIENGKWENRVHEGEEGGKGG